MFRQIQKYESAPIGCGLESHPMLNPENGFVERVKRPMDAKLADPRLFDATACVNAGVNLQQVKSNVFGVFPESVAAPAPALAPDPNNEEDNNEE